MGIALAFLVFWSLVAVGSFLLLTAVARLRRAAARRTSQAEVLPVSAADSLAIGLHLMMGLVGALLIVAGLYATYVVLLAR
ncbi:MAG: hypothetical protein RB148_04200 [Armatimonadota bacterium]|nr:hypothetical protein [Armatimonadota bacterium]